MSRTVTALYDTREEAEAARARLSAAVDVEGQARIIDKSSMGSGSGGSSGFHSVPLTHEDRHAYGEGLRRGGFMLCAEVDGDEDSNKIVQILEQTSSVDLDDRQESWRQEGWTPATATAGTTTQPGMQTASTGLGTTGAALGGTATGGTTTGNVVEEQHIPIVEEQLVVGKREVNRGGARIRTYVREVPVHEQVSLREEHVSVERVPVDQTLRAGGIDAGQAFQDRTIEVTETAEEAVVAKEARVKEELVVRKTAEEHVETIDDTVRRTEVEVDEGMSGTRPAIGFGADKARGALDGHDDPNRGPLDRAANALSGHDDPNRGPLDRAANALNGHDDPNRGPLDRAANALDRKL
jgi:uncharacterized protein (TIGR02271 family)